MAYHTATVIMTTWTDFTHTTCTLSPHGVLQEHILIVLIVEHSDDERSLQQFTPPTGLQILEENDSARACVADSISEKWQ